MINPNIRKNQKSISFRSTLKGQGLLPSVFLLGNIKFFIQVSVNVIAII